MPEVAAASNKWHTAMTPTWSKVTSRPSVSALRMIGNRYRLRRGLVLLPVNHNTPVMNITMDHDSISNRVRVRRGKKRRARNKMIATANAPSRPSTGQGWAVSDR